MICVVGTQGMTIELDGSAELEEEELVIPEEVEEEELVTSDEVDEEELVGSDEVDDEIVDSTEELNEDNDALLETAEELTTE